MGFFSRASTLFHKVSDTFSFENLEKIAADSVKLFKNVKQTFLHLTGVIGAGQTLFDTVVGEIDAWKHFKEDIRINSRVINLEIAIKKTRALIEGIPQSWRAILDIFSQVRKAIQKDIVAEEGAALLAVETAGLSEVATGIAILYQVLSFVADIIQDFQTIVDELKRLRLEIEKLDTIFLQQDNKRKYLKAKDGRRIRVRIGHLHSAGI
jgi:SMC interacting uncharacterized protein involved in chromosome segregation